MKGVQPCGHVGWQKPRIQKVNTEAIFSIHIPKELFFNRIFRCIKYIMVNSAAVKMSARVPALRSPPNTRGRKPNIQQKRAMLRERRAKRFTSYLYSMFHK